MLKTNYQQWSFKSQNEDFSLEDITFDNHVIFKHINFLGEINKKVKKVKSFLEKNGLKEMPKITNITSISRLELPKNNKYFLDERFYKKTSFGKFFFKKNIRIKAKSLIISWSIMAPEDLFNSYSFVGTLNQFSKFIHKKRIKEKWQQAKTFDIDILKKKNWELQEHDYLKVANQKLNFNFITSHPIGFLQHENKIICSPLTNSKPKAIIKSWKLHKGVWHIISLSIWID